MLAAYNSKAQSPLLPPVVAHDITVDQQVALEERADDYPGVHVIELTIRSYPAADQFGDAGLAAQVLGYVGSIPADQLSRLEKKGYQPGDTIGLDGVEAAYESVLRGQAERVTVNVDPRGPTGWRAREGRTGPGRPDRATHDRRAHPVRGRTRAYRKASTAARQLPPDPTSGLKLTAPAGAVVVLDAQDGSVVAMASNPSYPLKWWVGGISQANYNFLTNAGSNYPLLNRATEGQYAPGSAFKLVTALAMTKYNMRSVYETYNDQGSVTIRGTTYQNDESANNGSVNLQRAITVSSDTYFYTLGFKFWQAYDGGDLNTGLGLQTEAKQLGFGAPTGFDLAEASGRVPDPTWKKNFAKLLYADPVKVQQNSIWYPADQILYAVGQGDGLVTPLQLANAYATFANDGTLLTPHVAMAIENPTSKQVKPVAPVPHGHVVFDEFTRQIMESGFKGVVQDPAGTAYGAFQGFDFAKMSVVGKTGTAQVNGKGPTSVFASYFPADAPKYVVLALVEQGGHGAATVAPIVRRVIEAIMDPASATKPDVPIGTSAKATH